MFLLPSSFFLLPSSFFLLPSSFFLLPSSFFLLPPSFHLFFFFFFLSFPLGIPKPKQTIFKKRKQKRKPLIFIVVRQKSKYEKQNIDIKILFKPEKPKLWRFEVTQNQGGKFTRRHIHIITPAIPRGSTGPLVHQFIRRPSFRI